MHTIFPHASSLSTMAGHLSRLRPAQGQAARQASRGGVGSGGARGDAGMSPQHNLSSGPPGNLLSHAGAPASAPPSHRSPPPSQARRGPATCSRSAMATHLSQPPRKARPNLERMLPHLLPSLLGGACLPHALSSPPSLLVAPRGLGATPRDAMSHIGHGPAPAPPPSPLLLHSSRGLMSSSASSASSASGLCPRLLRCSLHLHGPPPALHHPSHDGSAGNVQAVREQDELVAQSVPHSLIHLFIRSPRGWWW